MALSSDEGTTLHEAEIGGKTGFCVQSLHHLIVYHTMHHAAASTSAHPHATPFEPALLSSRVVQFRVSCVRGVDLSVVAGFEMPTVGRILVSGQDMMSMPVSRRPQRVVRQTLALILSFDGGRQRGSWAGRVPHPGLGRPTRRDRRA